MNEEQGRQVLSTADKIILAGHILSAVAMTLISIGAIIRNKEIPDHMVFNNTPTRPPSNTAGGNYWDK